VVTHNLASLLASYRSDQASLDRAAQLVASLKSAAAPRLLDTRGRLAFREGDYAQALPLLRQALQHAPDSPLLHYRLGMAQLKSSDQAAPRRNLDAAVKSGRAFPGLNDARMTLASIRRSG
jgi:Flp pilus assembly protein TadD